MTLQDSDVLALGTHGVLGMGPEPRAAFHLEIPIVQDLMADVLESCLYHI